MDPGNFRFGGGPTESQFHLLTAALLAMACILVTALPRRHVPVPFFLASLLIPFGEVLVVGGVHFPVFRLLLVVVWIRLLGSGILAQRFQLNRIDWMVIWWSLACIVTFTFLYQSGDALVNRIGFVYGTLGVYFFTRLCVQDSEDVQRIIKLFSLICAFIGVFMFLEQETGRNVFSVFGGVPEITPVREGRIRSQGPFGHPIIAGTFGATLLPLFVSLWWVKGAKRHAVLGILASGVTSITSASATPLMAIGAAILALFFWPIRKQMRLVRWALVLVLITLHLVMKAPVWSLIARVDVIGGSSSDHRYELVNRTILHFWDWWLCGANNTESWGYLMHDTANTFVDSAITQGFAGLALFIMILARCFGFIGNARKAAEGDSERERWYWAWGTWLFGNVVAFFGIVYFDQTMVYWYAFLGMVSAIVVSHEAEPSSSSTLSEPTLVAEQLDDRFSWRSSDV